MDKNEAGKGGWVCWGGGGYVLNGVGLKGLDQGGLFQQRSEGEEEGGCMCPGTGSSR